MNKIGGFFHTLKRSPIPQTNTDMDQKLSLRVTEAGGNGDDNDKYEQQNEH